MEFVELKLYWITANSIFQKKKKKKKKKENKHKQNISKKETIKEYIPGDVLKFFDNSKVKFIQGFKSPTGKLKIIFLCDILKSPIEKIHQ